MKKKECHDIVIHGTRAMGSDKSLQGGERMASKRIAKELAVRPCAEHERLKSIAGAEMVSSTLLWL
jgi:hypothetical protein